MVRHSTKAAAATVAVAKTVTSARQVSNSGPAVNGGRDVRLKRLIWDILMEAPEREMQLQKLYKEMQLRLPNLTTRKSDWRGTVRHILSAGTLFCRVPDPERRGCWRISEDAPLTPSILDRPSFAKGKIDIEDDLTKWKTFNSNGFNTCTPTTDASSMTSNDEFSSETLGDEHTQERFEEFSLLTTPPALASQAMLAPEHDARLSAAIAYQTQSFLEKYESQAPHQQQHPAHVSSQPISTEFISRFHATPHVLTRTTSMPQPGTTIRMDESAFNFPPTTMVDRRAPMTAVKMEENNFVFPPSTMAERSVPAGLIDIPPTHSTSILTPSPPRPSLSPGFFSFAQTSAPTVTCVPLSIEPMQSVAADASFMYSSPFDLQPVYTSALF